MLLGLFAVTQTLHNADLHFLGDGQLLVCDGFVTVGASPSYANFAAEATAVGAVLNSNVSSFTLWTFINCCLSATWSFCW